MIFGLVRAPLARALFCVNAEKQKGIWLLKSGNRKGCPYNDDNFFIKLISSWRYGVPSALKIS